MTGTSTSALQDNFKRMPNGPYNKRMQQLLKTTVFALAVLMALGTKADSQQLLSGDEIQSQIIGHSFRGKKGILSVSLHYAPYGTVTMQSPVGSGEGSWTLSGNRLCMKLMTGPRKADECLTFTSGPGGTYHTSNGLRLTKAK